MNTPKYHVQNLAYGTIFSPATRTQCVPWSLRLLGYQVGPGPYTFQSLLDLLAEFSIPLYAPPFRNTGLYLLRRDYDFHLVYYSERSAKSLNLLPGIGR